MKSLKQLSRQPVKTLLNIFLITLAVTLLLVSAGQVYTAFHAEKELNDQFVTAAMVSSELMYEKIPYYEMGQVRYWDSPLPHPSDEVEEWMQSVSAEHPEIIKKLESASLSCGYLPDVNISNYTNHNLYRTDDTSHIQQIYPEYMPTYASPYSRAMLEVTLKEIEQVLEMEDADCLGILTQDGKKTVSHIAIQTIAQVEQVYGLEPGFASPVGRELVLTIAVADAEAMEKLNLTVGQRYLVYGINYRDRDWEFRHFIQRQLGIDELEEKNIRYYTDIAKAIYRARNPDEYPVAYYRAYPTGFELTNLNIHYLNGCSLLASDPASFRNYILQTDKNGNKYAVESDIHYEKDENGNDIEISQQEYALSRTRPVIAAVPQGGEAFLKSPEGKLWQQALNEIQVNNHAFPIIGVERVAYQPAFAMQSARLTAGRDFSRSEWEKGENVCIIDEDLAKRNHLHLGSHITVQYYTPDLLASEHNYAIHAGHGIYNPAAYAYTTGAPMEEPKTYRIVGLYQKQRQEQDNDLTDFTQNTIFVPITSVTGKQFFTNQGIFRTIVIQNGKLPEFQRLASQSGLDTGFAYAEQGFENIAPALENYRVLSGIALAIGLVGYAIILSLFLLLFFLKQKKTAVQMEQIGASQTQKLGHCMLSSLGIFVPGTVLGFLVSLLLWRHITGLLAEETLSVFAASVPGGVIVAMAGLQLAAVSIVTAAISLVVIRHRKLGT